MTNLSDEVSLGSSGLYFITRKNRTDRISAQLEDEVGCLQYTKTHTVQTQRCPQFIQSLKLHVFSHLKNSPLYKTF